MVGISLKKFSCQVENEATFITHLVSYQIPWFEQAGLAGSSNVSWLNQNSIEFTIKHLCSSSGETTLIRIKDSCVTFMAYIWLTSPHACYQLVTYYNTIFFIQYHNYVTRCGWLRKCLWLTRQLKYTLPINFLKLAQHFPNFRKR